jgi:tetraacyldisaccharide 4'-kinase
MTLQRPETPTEKLIHTLLSPAAVVYQTAASLRNRAYSMGYYKQYHAAAPVISVGNLNCGGTGKTPITIDLARRVIQSGKKVAILSRGYKRKSSEPVVIVSDGNGQLATAYDAGDEPYMMARAVPGAVVLVGKDRRATAELAVTHYQCEVIILDDGFQHLKVARNEDVVLLDYYDDPFIDYMLPQGRLREPVSSLSRATWVVLTKVPAEPDPAVIGRFKTLVRKHAPGAKLTSCMFVPTALSDPGNPNEPGDLGSLSGAKVAAFCGIAKPASVFNLLQSLGANIVSKRSFPDHHWYNPADLKALRTDATTSGAEIIVTTEKDACRIQLNSVSDLPIRVLELQTRWLGSVPALPGVKHALKERKSSEILKVNG